MKTRNTAKVLAFVALGSVASTAGHSAAASAKTLPSIVETCQSKKAIRMQECILFEGISDCKQTTGDDDKFYECMETLSVYGLQGEAKKVNVTVSVGDEVFSMRFGHSMLFSIVSLTVTTIDDESVRFELTEALADVGTLKSHDTLPAVSTVASWWKHSLLTAGFGGSTNENAWNLERLEIWDFKVEKAEGGKATVSFSTTDPSLVVLAGK